MKISDTKHKNEDQDIDSSLLSHEILRLLDSYEELNKIKSKESKESNYKVSQVLGSLAFLYERVRNVLDYKGDHLLRRNAIERIIKRQIWENKSQDFQKLTENLIKELIWARYIKNDSVSKDRLQKLSGIINKYRNLFLAIELNYKNREAENYSNWFIGVLSSEIEETLDPDIFLKESLNYEVFSWFRDRFRWEGHSLDQKDRDIQIFISIHRSLTKSDKAGVRYRLLKAYVPKWLDKNFDLDNEFKNVLDAKNTIEKQLDSPYQPRMFRFIQRHIPAFFVLKDYIDKDYKIVRKDILKPELFEKEIGKICKEKYSEIGSRIRTGIFRSVIYIFLTKALLAMLMEIPYELFVAKSVNYLTLSINVIFPPFLMFMIGSTIKKPDDENTKRITQIIKSFVYKDDDVEKIPFSLERKIGGIITRVFLAFYIFLFFLMFSAIGLILIELGFNVLSATIFFVFLSMVLLFVYRVRYSATELNVKGEKEGFRSHLSSLITLPFINLGSLLSQGFQRINFFLLIMDFLIEAPLKNVITVIEEWSVYIKEKKEEVIEVPN